MGNVMKNLFCGFEENDIKYVHFKSNTSLEKSFQGRGDFDVLVDSSRIADVEAVIIKNGGKRFNPPRLGRYPGVDNWLFFDEESGVLYHLHLHYQLDTGKSLVKDYVLPWKELLFETRVKDQVYDIYVTDPNLELILLLTRIVLKSKTSKRFRAGLGKYELPASMKTEWLDLRKKSADEKIYSCILQCGYTETDAGEIMHIIQQGKMTGKDFCCLSRIVRKAMRHNRRMSGCTASVLSLYYLTRRKVMTFVKNRSDSVSMIKKVHDTRGLIIAFVGVDGAGKSTVTEEITKWLNVKIECKRFYMGSGDGKTPFAMKMLNAFKRRKAQTGRVAKSSGNIITVSKYRQPVKYFRRMMRMHAFYAVDKSNYKKLLTMHRYRMNGGISLLDRFPQIEYVGMNDGAKLAAFRDTFKEHGGIDRLIAKETEKLSIVKEIKPDIIFRLNITAQTSMLRKPEQKNIEAYQKKLDDLYKITFQNAPIVDIDAEQPHESELLEIKKIIWEKL